MRAAPAEIAPMHARLALLALTLFVTRPLPAQQPAHLEPGARVRLVSARREVIAEGRLVRLAADTAVLTDGPRAWPYRLGPDCRLETVVGRRSHAGRGALLGGLIGGVLGAAAGAGMRQQGAFTIGPDNVAEGAASLGLVGAALGGLIGALSGEEVWAPLDSAARRP